MTAADVAAVRRAYARQMVALAEVADDARLETAFATVPRERFLGPPPWRIARPWGKLIELPSTDPLYAYQNVLFALAPERGVNNGEPALHARLLSGLAPKPGAKVVHVGCGTGYYTAIIAQLVGAAGGVTAVEIDAELATMARCNLADWPQVDVVTGDASALPSAPVDGIYVNASISAPAPPWVEQLEVGGRLVFPLGVPGRHGFASAGAALSIERHGDRFAARYLCPALFILAEGALGTASRTDVDRLRAAFEGGGVERVKRLYWREPVPPENCWFWSSEWSLGYDD